MRPSQRDSILRSVVVGFVSLGVMAEVMHSRAASLRVPESASTSVVVLGYPSWRGGRPHPVQRWRVKLAKKTIDRHGADRVVLSGGQTRSGQSEASVMAKLAVAVGIDPTIIILESESMNTWSNVRFSSTLVADSAVVILVSDPVHAAWARRYWLRQHPSDVDRVFVTPCAGLGSWWMKIPTALDGFRRSAQSVLRAGAQRERRQATSAAPSWSARWNRTLSDQGGGGREHGDGLRETAAEYG